MCAIDSLHALCLFSLESMWHVAWNLYSDAGPDTSMQVRAYFFCWVRRMHAGTGVFSCRVRRMHAGTSECWEYALTAADESGRKAFLLGAGSRFAFSADRATPLPQKPGVFRDQWAPPLATHLTGPHAWSGKGLLPYTELDASTCHW